jgi:nucleotide-binding universal stress UspA family protein
MRTLEWHPAIVEAQDIGETIVEQATKREVDLIVMTSRRRPHAAAIFGSTAEKVFQHARCPVLITHSPEREWVGLSTPEIDLSRILVPNDLSSDSKLALNYGMALAQEYRAELHLLHVLSEGEQDPPEFAWTRIDFESRHVNAARKLAELAQEAAPMGKLVTAVRKGDVAEQILNYVKESEIDLVCMGVRSPRIEWNRIVSSTSQYVLRRAECPVLVMPTNTSVSAKAA